MARRRKDDVNTCGTLLIMKENPIEVLAARFQQLPPNIRWLYAQSEIIEATALGNEPERGFRSRIAHWLVAVSSRIGLARMLAAVANLCLIFILYARQSLVRQVPTNGTFFVGIGALREPELVRQFEAMQKTPVVYLYEMEAVHFFRHGRVPLLGLLREMRSVWSEVWEHLHSQVSSGLDRAYLLSFLLMRGHRYAHVRAWFRQYLSQQPGAPAVGWSTASLFAYASIAAGMKTIHVEHGFQRRSLVYPDFAQSICFNGIDADHIRARLPRCHVTVVAEPLQKLATRRIAAVAGISWEPDGFDRIRPFIEWALGNDLPVIVRKHPADTSDYWAQWQGVTGVQITDGRGAFFEFLHKFRPRILASWYSTTLFDALVNGVVPVTVTPEDHEAALDTVFPFRELSLCWPDHHQLAKSVIDDEDVRAEFLTHNYARVIKANCELAAASLGVSDRSAPV